ncbi:MAG: DUF4965 domain-containing protein [Candidatus Marinimicrobia bacterium]|nr:DUF4965 domain-containing protein [Candidatus Neomarinimicrobiota bacterium]
MEPAEEVTIFLELRGAGLKVRPAGPDALALAFDCAEQAGDRAPLPPRAHAEQWVALTGARRGRRIERRVRLEAAATDRRLDVAWCAWQQPVLEVRGEPWPFRYHQRHGSLEAVTGWARREGAAIFENAARVDALVARNNCGPAVNHLLAQTLHAWLANTWWVQRGRRQLFTVWEGNCHFHSTVDVEFTQAPFYLAVWPELLGLELDAWPRYARSGRRTLGTAGRGTRYLTHDMGRGIQVGQPRYPHEMEVEETANYILLLFAHWRRTGDPRRIRRHAGTAEQFLRFLAACDSTGDGVPDRGVANTIDDAAPAIQYGRKQTYLAVKTLAAFATGAVLMQETGRAPAAALCRRQARRIRATLRARGWQRDHFVTLLDPRADGVVNPWTGRPIALATLPGWDAAHIYTANTLPLLDMVGFSIGLDEQRVVQDLQNATARCLREYGCAHSDHTGPTLDGQTGAAQDGLAGAALRPGWISMNILRDLAALRRGLDLRALSERYWEWQTLTNTQEPRLFFETFNGNNLAFYPRGVAVWGWFEALTGQVTDRVRGLHRRRPPWPQAVAPDLFHAFCAARPHKRQEAPEKKVQKRA